MFALMRGDFGLNDCRHIINFVLHFERWDGVGMVRICRNSAQYFEFCSWP
jgi:hypothetical protein